MISTRSESRTPPERFHPRVKANFMVKLLVNGKSIVAKARDLSMAGLYLLGDPMSDARRLTVCIPLPDDREVVTRCRVTRHQPEGMAVQFDQLDWDDLLALARYLHSRLP